ncbi:MAG: response regulator [Parcubacteria group bacterium]|nr:response regulator [Parcubacteria group bacterium]
MGDVSSILLIEDERLIRELTKEALLRAGFTVHEMIDGLQGLKEAQRNPPTLILLDIVLPKLDGFTVLKQLKASPATSSIPVVMFTNFGQHDEIKLAQSLGAAAYILKTNVEPQQIVETVRSVLARHTS